MSLEEKLRAMEALWEDLSREPDRIEGDGTYLMMNSEIVTAVAEGLKLTIVVVDNHGYQCILGLQRICGVLISETSCDFETGRPAH
jgi:TPP-dependent trihydroxycyclohexane-1,2-dione (THcHDO) dehydratase